MKNFLCAKCSTLIQKDSTPNSTGCPKGNSHSWYTLGDVGEKNYQCKKCSITVKSKNTPTSVGCPSGGSHSWISL
jgi:DNA-directed RNA polymerase subunit RPC12/RpoP